MIPNPANPQAFNRFSYVYNRPINFTDPSGHDPHWCSDDQGRNVNDSCLYNWLDGNTTGGGGDLLFAKYGVTVDKKFTRAQKRAIMAGLYRVGVAFANARGRDEEASQAFTAILDGGVNFNVGSTNASGDCLLVTSGGCTSSDSQINFWSMAGHGNEFIMMGNVIHELGHAYNNQLGKAPEKDMPYWMYQSPNPGRALFLQPNSLAPVPNACDDCHFWQFNRDLTATETFGDMFVAWTLGVWNLNPDNAKQVQAAQLWMNGWMPKP